MTEPFEPNDKYVEMQDIRKKFGPVEVLRGVTLQIARGEVVVGRPLHSVRSLCESSVSS